MNLIIDQGNTNLKLYLFEQNKIKKNFIYPINKIPDFFSENPKHAIYCSVSGNLFLEKKICTCPINNFTINTAIPIKNSYKSSTLGLDRLAAAVGAAGIFPNLNCLIIDLGTAITFDILTKNGEFLGGNISAGMDLRYKTLHEHTKNLPLLKFEQTDILFADNTKDAIICGVQNGILFEIEGYIEHCKQIYDNLTIILTGGDAKLFENKLNFNIFVEPNLVAYGLNNILNFNILKQKMN